MGRSKKPTIQDITNYANATTGTIDRVIHNGGINFLISQRSIFQGVQAVQVLVYLFVHDKLPSKIQYVPLDIIIKENVDYYLDS